MIDAVVPGELASVVLMCHAPIVVPEIGGDRATDCVRSTNAMRVAAEALVAARPEVLIIVSPHTPRPEGAWSVCEGALLGGHFGRFGAPQLRLELPVATEARDRLVQAMAHANVRCVRATLSPIDHGAMVPLWFVYEAGWRGPTVLFGLPVEPDVRECTQVGALIAREAAAAGQRWALVASGDMSHRLIPGAPSGYDPQAARFDEHVAATVRAGRLRAALDVSPSLRDLAAEDVIDTLAVATGAVGDTIDAPALCGYEGPFGVGYLVAVLRGVGAITLTSVARHAIAAAIEGRSFQPPDDAARDLSAPGGVFVTLWAPGHTLRGCIGTLQGSAEPLAQQVASSAVSAATRDPRFPPVAPGELDDLDVEVSLLGASERVAGIGDLDPARYGCIVVQGANRGVLLPDVDGVETAAQQVEIACRKGSIDMKRPYEIRRFEVQKLREAHRASVDDAPGA